MQEDMVTLDIGDTEETPVVVEDQFELQITDTIEDPVDVGAMAKQLEELKAEKEALASKADSSAQMTAAFSQFAEQLKGQATPPPSPTSAPGPAQVNVDWAALESEVKTDMFKNPFQAVMKTVSPAFQQMQNQLNFEMEALKGKNKLLDSKMALTGDQELSGIYAKYKDDIEKKVSVTGDYVAAAKEARIEHQDDIIAEKVAAAVAEALAAQTGKPAQTGFTNSGSMASAAAKTSVNSGPKVSSAMYEHMKQKALDWAQDPNDPEVMKDVYNTFKERGIIK